MFNDQPVAMARSLGETENFTCTKLGWILKFQSCRHEATVLCTGPTAKWSTYNTYNVRVIMSIFFQIVQYFDCNMILDYKSKSNCVAAQVFRHQSCPIIFWGKNEPVKKTYSYHNQLEQIIKQRSAASEYFMRDIVGTSGICLVWHHIYRGIVHSNF